MARPASPAVQPLEESEAGSGSTPIAEAMPITNIRCDCRDNAGFAVTLNVPREKMLAFVRDYNHDLYARGFLTPQILVEAHLDDISATAGSVMHTTHSPHDQRADFIQFGRLHALHVAARYLDGRVNDGSFWAYAHRGLRLAMVDYFQTRHGEISRRHVRAKRAQGEPIQYVPYQAMLDNGYDPVDCTAAGDPRHAAADALADLCRGVELSERDRSILHEKLVEEMTTKDIAKRHGICVTTVREAIVAAKLAIREHAEGLQ